MRTAGDGTITMVTGTGNEVGSVQAPIAVGVLKTSGSAVDLSTQDGGITATSIDTSGAAGASGANGGDVAIEARDAAGLQDTSIAITGDVNASGGNASAGTGGNGGTVEIFTLRRGTTGNDGGGDITVGGVIDTSGGDGTTGAVPRGYGAADVHAFSAVVDEARGNVAGGMNGRGGPATRAFDPGQGGAGNSLRDRRQRQGRRGGVDVSAANARRTARTAAAARPDGRNRGRSEDPGPERQHLLGGRGGL